MVNGHMSEFARQFHEWRMEAAIVNDTCAETRTALWAWAIAIIAGGYEQGPAPGNPSSWDNYYFGEVQ